jgi:hypothetical protein
MKSEAAVKSNLLVILAGLAPGLVVLLIVFLH